MDLRQASHGLHIASASRIYLVTPIWSPGVEAQAIKRGASNRSDEGGVCGDVGAEGNGGRGDVEKEEGGGGAGDEGECREGVGGG